MKFLGENGFSFDTWVKSGIPWIRPDAEKKQADVIQHRIEEIKTLKKSIDRQKEAAAAAKGGAGLDGGEVAMPGSMGKDFYFMYGFLGL